MTTTAAGRVSVGTAPASGAPDLHLHGLTKRFGATTAVDALDLTVPAGRFFALLGPSGCGKTTTLRLVAGFEAPSAGSIRIGSRDVTGDRPHQRPVNTVFQSYALFPHLDVFDNVAFGLRRRRARAVRAEVDAALELVQLGPLARRRPAQLSGGQQQRVALARAIVNRPAVLLLDEPLAALDLQLRRRMQAELKRIQAEVGLTFVHVTHDQEEALTLADDLAVMNAGRIEQLGSPSTIYDAPRSTFVANFLGRSNLLPASATGRSGNDLLIEVQGRRLALPLARTTVTSGALWLGVRPERMRIGDAGRDDGTAAAGTADDAGVRLAGTVTDAAFTGVATTYRIRLSSGAEVTAVQQNDGAPVRHVGESVSVGWRPEHAFGLDAAQDAAAGTAA